MRTFNSRSRIAIEARKEVIARLGLSAHSSFVEVAEQLIKHDNLFADIPKTRDEAIAFLHCYGLMLEWQKINPVAKVKPLPAGYCRSDVL
jgi:hypothetical protein